jgi:hypothetical protein
MKLKNYIPQAFNQLTIWLTNFITYLGKADIIARLKLNQDLIDSLKERIDTYIAACIKADATNAGSVDRLARRELAVSISKQIRKFVNTHLRYNEAMTDDDRKQLGLSIPDTKRTAEADPDEFPEIEVNTSILRQIGCRFINREHRTAKPRHVHGIELLYGFIPAEETPSFRHLADSLFSTRSFTKIRFSEEQRGLHLGLCARYENNTGGKGPFGPIITVFIP